MSDSKPSPTLEGGKVKNVKDAAEESQKEKTSNAIKSLTQLRREILSGGVDMPTAGITGGLRAIYKLATEMTPGKRLNMDDIKRAAKKLENKKILERAEAKVGDKGMKAGGLVKGKKKSVRPKKPSKAGRLAKRGYGAARK